MINRPDFYCNVMLKIESIIGRMLSGDDLCCRLNIRIKYSTFVLFTRELKPKRHGWHKDFECILFLFWLAAGLSYRVVANVFGVPRSTAFRVCTLILEDSLTLISKFIKLPNNNEVNEIGRQFSRKGESDIFLNAAGAIDGCIVKIECPVRLHDQYITRKLCYGIQLQVITIEIIICVRIMN